MTDQGQQQPQAGSPPTPPPVDHRGEAIAILKHYFQIAFQKSGCAWTAENDKEIAAGVDHMIGAAFQHLQAETQRAQQELLSQVTKCQYCGWEGAIGERDVRDVAQEHAPDCAWRQMILGAMPHQPRT